MVGPPTWLGLSIMTPNLFGPTEIVYFQFCDEVLTLLGVQSSWFLASEVYLPLKQMTQL